MASVKRRGMQAIVVPASGGIVTWRHRIGAASAA